MLTVPPTLEPLTLVEAKLRAGLDWADGDPRDALMTGFIAAARSMIERRTGIALLEQTHVVTLDRVAYSYLPFSLPVRPVQSVDIDAFDAGLYVLDPSSVEATPARLTLVSGTWPLGLTATIVAGFATVEELQAAAPDLVHAVGLLTAHFATLGRDLASVTPSELVPMGIAELLAPYEPVWLA